MIGGKLFRELAQVGGKDFGLVLEDVVAEIQPKLPGAAVEIVGHDRRFKGPVVHGQWEVVADNGNFVGCGRLPDDRGLAPALRTLQVLKYYDGDLRALRRTQGRVDGI